MAAERIVTICNRSGRPGRHRAEISAAFADLVAPVGRAELVVGKYLTVLLISLAAALLNLAVIAYLWRSPLLRDVFSEFPAAPVAPVEPN